MSYDTLNQDHFSFHFFTAKEIKETVTNDEVDDNNFDKDNYDENYDDIDDDNEIKMKDEYDDNDYIVVGKFSQNGTAEGKVPENIGKVAEMRIRVITHKKENWVLLNEVC